ncbi:LacI family DNA-binding transcriptional regulator, partial [Rhizobium ruizarguesonis]
MSRPKEPESKITIADVARAAGVSTMTVSRVLNDRGGASAETSQRIILAASEINSQPNPLSRR